MALKTYNPTTPSQRQLVLVDRSALYKGKPVKALTEGKHSSGGRNNNGRITVRFRGGGHKQTLPHGRLQAAQVRRAGQGRAARIRSEPHRFIALLKYDDGELAYILAPQRLGGRRHRGVGRACRREARQRHADGEHAGRHHRAQYRVQDRQGRAARALGRHLRADRRPRPGLRHPAAQFGRAAPGARQVHGDGRRGVEPRSHEHLDRQGRAASAGSAGGRTIAASR